MQNRWQVIIWTNAYPVHWRIYAALGGISELAKRKPLIKLHTCQWLHRGWGLMGWYSIEAITFNSLMQVELCHTPLWNRLLGRNIIVSRFGRWFVMCLLTAYKLNGRNMIGFEFLFVYGTTNASIKGRTVNHHPPTVGIWILVVFEMLFLIIFIRVLESVVVL